MRTAAPDDRIDGPLRAGEVLGQPDPADAGPPVMFRSGDEYELVFTNVDAEG